MLNFAGMRPKELTQFGCCCDLAFLATYLTAYKHSGQNKSVIVNIKGNFANCVFLLSAGHFVLTAGGHETGHPQTASHTVSKQDFLQGIVTVCCFSTCPSVPTHWRQSCLMPLQPVLFSLVHSGTFRTPTLQKHCSSEAFWPCWKGIFLMTCKTGIFVWPSSWRDKNPLCWKCKPKNELIRSANNDNNSIQSQ